MIPFLAELEPVTFSNTLGGQILATDFFTEGLLRISSMLNGVKGLLEFAGGGSWSNGARLLSSPLDCNTEPAFMSLLEVIAVPKNRCLQKKVDYFIQMAVLSVHKCFLWCSAVLVDPLYILTLKSRMPQLSSPESFPPK